MIVLFQINDERLFHEDFLNISLSIFELGIVASFLYIQIAFYITYIRWSRYVLI